MDKLFFSNKKKIIIFSFVLVLGAGGFFLFSWAYSNKKLIAIKSLDILDKVSGLLLIEEDKQKELSAVNGLVKEFTKKDGVERKFLVLLQNNMELRPGGGFLGQYAVIKIKDGEIISDYFEDANLLDQRISAKIPAPYPFKKMIQTRNWKFRDSNFSPDFPVNAEKAAYFMRLAGRSSDFDGVIAVNADVLNSILKITGPVTAHGIEFNSENAVLNLEEKVEKIYIMNPDIDTQNRKAILKSLGSMILDKAAGIGNISKIAELGHEEMQKKNIMLNFKDPELQKLAESVHWDGKVAQDWAGDYLMAVDANMGALKTDYHMRREISYDIDLTAPKPVATLNILYKNTAPYGDWRTSDYHSYLRVYVPEGSNLLDRKMVSYPNIGTELGKTYFGFTLHVLIGQETNAMIKYELPENFNKENYKLLIQKQSGAGSIPVKIRIKTDQGEFNQEGILTKDLKFQLDK